MRNCEEPVRSAVTSTAINTSESNSPAMADTRTGKYLAFRLGKEDFAIQVLKVREIVGIQDITSVPQMPAYVKGVINLRGKVIPVVDLRLKFGLAAGEIEDTPDFGEDVSTPYLLGMAKVKGNVKMLLDIDQVLANSETLSLDAMLN
jgi:purine-binding chemotaxis protein CheW